MIIGLYNGCEQLDADAAIAKFQSSGVNFHINCRTKWLEQFTDAGLNTCIKAFSKADLRNRPANYAYVAHEVTQFPPWAESISHQPVCLYNNDYQFGEHVLAEQSHVALAAINAGNADDWWGIAADVERYTLAYQHVMRPRIKRRWRSEAWVMVNVPSTPPARTRPGNHSQFGMEIGDEEFGKQIRGVLMRVAHLEPDGLLVRSCDLRGGLQQPHPGVFDALAYVSKRV